MLRLMCIIIRKFSRAKFSRLEIYPTKTLYGSLLDSALSFSFSVWDFSMSQKGVSDRLITPAAGPGPTLTCARSALFNISGGHLTYSSSSCM